MFILITYDIKTTTQQGRRRLRSVAKICQNFGQRVQNSVFELKVNEAQFLIVQKQINEIINEKTDSIRFYRLGSNYQSKVLHVGAKESYDIDGLLLL